MRTQITGASYIGRPVSHTVMYISKKVAHLLSALEPVEGCLIFAEQGIEVPAELAARHEFRMVANPQAAYAEYVIAMNAAREARDRQRQYTLQPGGWYRGANVTIGEGAYIEPGVLIGHDVMIGKNATLLAGCVIKHAVIGDDFYADECATIGTNGFTMAQDAQGQLFRIPTLGRVVIGNGVEVGNHANVARGSAGDTVLHDHVKLDALVQIAHDDNIGASTEITAGSIVGGFVEMGEHGFVGMNSSLHNRIQVGDNVFIGMGSVVVRRVRDNRRMFGNPAHSLL